jgi:hypothetical protein
MEINNRKVLGNNLILRKKEEEFWSSFLYLKKKFNKVKKSSLKE